MKRFQLCLFLATIGICFSGCIAHEKLTTTHRTIECTVKEKVYRDGRWRLLCSFTIYSDATYVWEKSKYYDLTPGTMTGILPADLFEQIRETKDKHEGQFWNKSEFDVYADNTMNPLPKSFGNLFRFLRSTRVDVCRNILRRPRGSLRPQSPRRQPGGQLKCNFARSFQLALFLAPLSSAPKARQLKRAESPTYLQPGLKRVRERRPGLKRPKYPFHFRAQRGERDASISGLARRGLKPLAVPQATLPELSF